MGSRLKLRNRRWLVEKLEDRIAPSDMLVIIGTAWAAQHADSTPPASPQEKHEPAESWRPDETIVPHTIIPVKAPGRVTISPQILDGLIGDSLKPVSQSFAGLGPDFEPAESVRAPRYTPPAPLNVGVGPGNAPSGSTAPGGGGGGGGGGSQPDMAAAAGAQQLHNAAPVSSGQFSPLDDYEPPPPSADDSSASGYHDQMLWGQVSGEGGTSTLTYSVHDAPASGTLTLNEDGSYSFMPEAGFVGTLTFTFDVTDSGTGLTSETPGTVTMTFSETPPTVMNQDYTTYHDSIVSQMAPGVLANDLDVEGDPLTFSLQSGPSHAASFTLNADGSFDFQPMEHYVGDDAFVISVSDGLMATTETISLHFTDTKPLAANDGYAASPVDDTWGLSWNKLDTDTGSITENVLPNDTDAESDTLVPILDTPPPQAAGTFTPETDPNTGNWTGQFTFQPAAGFGGWVTFTYHVTDGIMNSDPATAKILVQKIDLDLHDGGDRDPYDGEGGQYIPGPEVPDDKEESQGAFTVANNVNDTNGSDVNDDGEHPVDKTFAGRAEVDLMTLVINQPVPLVDPEAPVEVAIYSRSDQGLARIWDDPIKSNELDTAGTYSIAAGDIPAGGKVVYIELPQGSIALRDYEVVANYNIGSDSVAATAVWATVSKVESGDKSANDIAEEFGDMDEFLTAVVGIFGGTGQVDPIYTGRGAGLGNGIVVQWKVFPERGPNDGTWEGDGVYFDAARQIEVEIWKQQNKNGPYATDLFRAYPTQEEQANDEAGDIDESDHVTSDGHFYQYDRPGFLGSPTVAGGEGANGFIYRANFKDFLRVGFTERPFGTGPVGSRVSEYQPWYTRLDMTADENDDYQRNPNGLNGIGTGQVDIDNPDPTQ